MTKEQIKKLAYLITLQGDVSEDVSKWILANLSKPDMKLFIRHLNNALRHSTVTAKYAGVMPESSKMKLYEMFPGKKIVFTRQDDEIGAGIKINFGDYTLDYTVSGIVKKIMKDIRENL